jgi:hypothetical protein
MAWLNDVELTFCIFQIFPEFDATLATGTVYKYEFPQPHAALACAEQISELKSTFEFFKNRLQLGRVNQSC